MLALRTICLCSLFIVFSQKPFAQQEPVSQTVQKLTIYTENYPPLNYEKDGLAEGLSVDILLEAFKRIGVTLDQETIIVAPWARGYVETQKRANTMLFSTTRSTAREQLFGWVGPIGYASTVLMARKDSSIRLLDKDDFFTHRYGVVQHDRGEQALKELGLPSSLMIQMPSPVSAARMLARDRVDLWAYERLVSFWLMQKIGFKAHDYEVVHSFETFQYYYAFNKETPGHFLKVLQTAIDSMRMDGTMETIVEAYMPGAAGSFLVPYETERQ